MQLPRPIIGVLFTSLTASFLTSIASAATRRCEAFDDFIPRLEIRADFKKIYEGRKGDSFGQLEGLEDVDTPQAPVDRNSSGTLKDLEHPEKVFPIKLRARGNTSVVDPGVEFPKLKVSIDKKTTLDESIFDDAATFRLNTHLNERGVKTGMGRAAGDEGPQREFLAYQLAQIIGLQTPNTHLAHVDYVDVNTERRTTRYALMLDSNKSMAKRLKAKEIDEATLSTDDQTKIDPVEAAKFFLFHRMIGNNDVYLRVNEEPRMTTETNRSLWNVMLFERADGVRLPVVYDLDLALNVRGRPNSEPSLPEFGLNKEGSRGLAFGVASLFEKFTKEQLREANKQIQKRKTDLYLYSSKAPVDPAGRAMALRSLDTYFETIDAVLDIPVIANAETRFFANAKGSQDKLKNHSITDGPGTLRKGTPVQVLGREGRMLKVRIIDFQGLLEKGQSDVGYIRAESPIVDSLTMEQIRKTDDRDMAF